MTARPCGRGGRPGRKSGGSGETSLIHRGMPVVAGDRGSGNKEEEEEKPVPSARTRGHLARLAAVAVTIVPLALAGWLAGTANAASAASGVSSAVIASNWYFDDPAGSAPVATGASTPTGVPAGDLGTGFRTAPAPEADKIASYIFDVSGFSKGSRVSSFVVAVPVDTAGDPASAAQLTNGAPPALVACRNRGAISPGAGPTTYTSRPPLDCDRPATGTFDAASATYTFDVTSYAQLWVDDANTGMSIIPDPKNPPATTVSLSLKTGGAVKVTAAAESASTAGTSSTGSGSSAGSGSVPAAGPVPVAAGTTSPAPRPTAKAPPAPVATTAASAAPPAAVLAPTGDVSGQQAQPAPAPAPVTGALPGPMVAAAPVAAPGAVAGPVVAAATGEAAPAPIAAAPAEVAATRAPLQVSSPFGVVFYVLLFLVGGGLLALLSLGLGTPQTPTTRGDSSRLARVLARGSLTSS